MCRYDADTLTIKGEALMALERDQVLTWHDGGFRDSRERKSEGLVADLEHQRSHDRQRQRQLEAERDALAQLGGQLHTAADRFDHVLHGVEAHPPPRDVGHRRRGGESRKEEELEQLRIREFLRHLGRRQTALDDLHAQPFHIHAPAIVREREHEEASPVARLEPNRADRPLAGGHTHVRHLETVVEAVPNHVVQRSFQPLEDLAVHLGGATENLELRLFAQLP